MEHDVFISYSSADKTIAHAMCHYLEEAKIRCWIAPRDIEGGKEYGDVIEAAIAKAKIFIIVYSASSSVSKWVKAETNLALSGGKVIIPYKIDDVVLSGAMRLYLNDKHWIDAFPHPSAHFQQVLSATQGVLNKRVTPALEKGKPTVKIISEGKNPKPKKGRYWVIVLLCVGGVCVYLRSSHKDTQPQIGSSTLPSVVTPIKGTSNERKNGANHALNALAIAKAAINSMSPQNQAVAIRELYNYYNNSSLVYAQSAEMFETASGKLTLLGGGNADLIAAGVGTYMILCIADAGRDFACFLAWMNNELAQAALSAGLNAEHFKQYAWAKESKKILDADANLRSEYERLRNNPRELNLRFNAIKQRMNMRTQNLQLGYSIDEDGDIDEDDDINEEAAIRRSTPAYR